MVSTSCYPVLRLLVASNIHLTPCAGTAEQSWTFSPGSTPKSSTLTNIMMSHGGGCWEITGCSTKPSAAIGTGYGCKPLPASCASKCACNGAWNWNSNGTITSVMDGQCATVKGTSIIVDACTAATATAQRFTASRISRSSTAALQEEEISYAIKASTGLCVTGQPAPTPAPTPLPCAAVKTAAACNATNRRCVWNPQSKTCSVPPPPLPCANITKEAECKPLRCYWYPATHACGDPPPLPPLPPCAADHTCANNGLSATPPMGW